MSGKKHKPNRNQRAALAATVELPRLLRQREVLLNIVRKEEEAVRSLLNAVLEHEKREADKRMPWPSE
jgi:hypothetical protein